MQSLGKRQKAQEVRGDRRNARFDHYSSINAILRRAHGEQLLRKRIARAFN